MKSSHVEVGSAAASITTSLPVPAMRNITHRYCIHTRCAANMEQGTQGARARHLAADTLAAAALATAANAAGSVATATACRRCETPTKGDATANNESATGKTSCEWSAAGAHAFLFFTYCIRNCLFSKREIIDGTLASTCDMTRVVRSEVQTLRQMHTQQVSVLASHSTGGNGATIPGFRKLALARG